MLLRIFKTNRLIRMVLALASVLLFGSCSGGARVDAGSVTVWPYVLETLDGSERVAAEFGTLRVPENRTAEVTDSIELAFVRLRSTAAEPGPPIFYLAGGPGGSGIQDGRWTGEARYFDYRALGDVVFLDQRGTGLSLPDLDCPVRWDMPLDEAITRARAIEIARVRSATCAEFWRERGVDLAAYNTVESADDIDALREALGYDSIRLVGGSYGSHLGLAYLRRHESAVDRAILALVEGPNHTLKLPGALQRQLATIDSLVAEDPDLRERIPDFSGLVEGVLRSLEESPVTVRTEHPVTGDTVNVVVGSFDLRWITAAAQGSLRFIRELPVRYLQISNGDYRWLGSIAAQMRTGWIWSAMTHQMDCASGATEARSDRIAREAEESILSDLADFPTPYQCGEWDVDDLGDDFRQDVHSEVPVLLMAGTLDGRTPVANAVEVLDGLPNGGLLVVDGLAHGFAHTPAMRDSIQGIWMDFLRGGPAPSDTLRFPFAFVDIDELE